MRGGHRLECLFVAGAANPGSSVLLLGTGGVSLWALRLAKVAGLFTIITSLQDEVFRLTEGRGMDLVVEVAAKEPWPAH